MIDLQNLLDMQSKLQRSMPSPHPTDLFILSQGGDSDIDPDDTDRYQAINFLHWNVTAATDELHELLGEIGWKPWAKSRHINLQAARAEWIDAWHFMMNMALVLGMDAEMIHEMYVTKNAKNLQRQVDGYDGVSTKCPGCKRALDDDAVECIVNKTTYFCVKNGTWQAINP